MAELTLMLAEIDSDDRYSFTFPHLPERYADCEDKFPGLPLLVVDGERRVICGHDFLLLSRQQGRARVRALQIDLGPAEALLLNYNVLDRLFGLNLCEKLLFLKKILPLCPMENIRRGAELNFTLDDRLRKSLELLLAEPFRTCLAAGRLGLKAALKAADMPEKIRVQAIGLLRACRFSESQQWLVVQWLEEIAFREKKALGPLLAAAGLDLLLEKEMPQKKILDILRGLRYPGLAQGEREWDRWQKRMATGSISFAHTPFFSDERVQITLTLENRLAAEKLLSKLKKVL